MTDIDRLPDPIESLVTDPPAHLRAVVISTADGVDPLYFRDDVKRDVDPAALERKAEALSGMIQASGDQTPFGALKTHLRIYDGVTLLHHRIPDGHVVVTVDAGSIDPLELFAVK